MSQNLQFANTKVNTKSLLGRQAVVGQLIKIPSRSPEKSGSPFQNLDERSPGHVRGKEGNFSFNNNIYNNFSPQHSIEAVDGVKRLLPKADQKNVEKIKALKEKGKIKTTGRSPVPLQLYAQAEAKDHLYITKVTKHVPVAHDQQLQQQQSEGSPRSKKDNTEMGTSGDYATSNRSGSGRDMMSSDLTSKQFMAQQDLQTMLNKGFTIVGSQSRDDPLRKFISVDEQKARQQEPFRMVGQVNLKLPPGYEFKQPSVQIKGNLSKLGEDSSKLAYKQTTDHTQNNSIITVDNFNSGARMPNKDSLYQETDRSLNDPNAFNETRSDIMMSRSRRKQQQTSQFDRTVDHEDFYASGGGFHSVVRKTTHQEINAMLKQANPEVYKEQARQKAQKLRAVSLHHKPTLHERKQLMSLPIKGNKWHAPVKKQEILQNVLDRTNEPTGKPLDIAIIAHQIIKFGFEREAGWQKKVNAAQREGDSKYGTGSIRKQTEAKALAIAARKRAELRANDAAAASFKVSGEEFTSKLDSKGTLGMVSAGLTPKQLGIDAIHTTMVTPNDDDLGAGHAKKPVTGHKIDSSNVNSVVGSLIVRQKLGDQMRANLVSNLLGTGNTSKGALSNRKNSEQREPSALAQVLAKAKAMKQARERGQTPTSGASGIVLPNIGNLAQKSDGQVTPSAEEKERVRPDILARRRARKNMTLTSGRKQSYALMASFHRSSNISIHSMKSGKSQPAHMQSTETLREDPQQNIEQIHLMLEQLEIMDNKGKRPNEQRGMYGTNPFQASPKKLEESFMTQSQSSRPILNIDLGGTMQPKRSNQKKGNRQKKLRLRRGFSKGSDGEAAKTMTAKDIEQLFVPRSPSNMQTLPAISASRSTKYQEETKESPAKVKQRLELEQSYKENNESIRQIMKEMAFILQRADEEALFLRKNVIQPSSLNKYSLSAYLGKTIQLDVGQLYQPLKFIFSEFTGDFNVYFSTKVKTPNEENGYDQMASCRSQVLFPTEYEKMAPNMVRYSKDKVLYITIESNKDCTVGISMTHNKKDAPEMTVASVFSSGIDMEQLRVTSHATLVDSSTPGSPKSQQPDIDAEDAVAALNSMLGSEEKTMHAAKLYQMMKKKIKYMVYEDLDVAKDFLDLIEVLKNHKNAQKSQLQQSILSQHPEIGSQIDQHHQQNNDIARGAIGGVITPALVQNGFESFFQQDLYTTLKQGQITRQQYNEIRQQNQKQKKEEIEKMNRVRALELSTAQDTRKELRDLIMQRLNKYAADNKFIKQWYRTIKVHQVLTSFIKGVNKKKDEARLLASCFWTVLKIKIRMARKIRRNGPTQEERQRRSIKMSLASIGSAVHLREVTAGNKMLQFLRGLRMRLDIKHLVIDNGHWVRHIQERFRSYWQVRTQQVKFIVKMIMRERERFQITMIKQQNSDLRQLGWFVGKVSEESALRVANSYYQACQYKYEPTFFAWRNRCNELRAKKTIDLSGGYSFPFMQPRGIMSMEEIDYNTNYKSKSIQMYLETGSQLTKNKFRYFMNAEIDDAKSSKRGKKGVNPETLSLISGSTKERAKREKRAKAKLRAKNPEFATLEDAIAKQEEKVSVRIFENMTNCAIYPPRPAMRFMPSPAIQHMLLHQAVMIQHSNLLAPQSWIDKFDLPQETSRTIRQSQIASTESVDQTVIIMTSRLTSKQATPIITDASPGLPLGKQNTEVSDFLQISPSRPKMADGVLEVHSRLQSRNSRRPAAEGSQDMSDSRLVSRAGSERSIKQDPMRMSKEQSMGDFAKSQGGKRHDRQQDEEDTVGELAELDKSPEIVILQSSIYTGDDSVVDVEDMNVVENELLEGAVDEEEKKE